MPAKEKEIREGRNTDNRLGDEPLGFTELLPNPTTQTKATPVGFKPFEPNMFPSPESSTKADHGSPREPDFLPVSSFNQDSPPTNRDNAPAQISEEILEHPIQLAGESRAQVSHDSTAAITEVAVKSSSRNCCSSICRPFSLSVVSGFFARLLGQGNNHNNPDLNRNSGGRN